VLRAERLLSEASRGFATRGNNAELALCASLLALGDLLLGDLDGALEQHRACLALTEGAGETWLRSWALWVAGMALWTRGDTTTAQDHMAESLRLKRLITDPLGIAILLETHAWLAAATEPERAATLLGAAQTQWDKIDTSTEVLPILDTTHRETLLAVQTQLGDTAFDVARSQGRALDLTAAIALALEEQPVPTAKETSGHLSRAARSVLTRRERQIAELIHTGLSNKQIAETLVISPRTAETHVENILTKLGFTSRTQVAAWIGEQLGSGDR